MFFSKIKFKIQKSTLFLFSLCFFFLPNRLTSQESISRFLLESNYAEYTLENQFEIFVLEDFSKAQVSLELSVRAGNSSQSPENAGFFPLYARLFNFDSEGKTAIKGLSAECNADSTRYKISVSPILLEDTIKKLSDLTFRPSFSDSAMEKEFKKIKEEYLQNEKTPAFFINTAIDSRVFSKEPWKNESCLNPAAFAGKNNEEARTILTSIKNLWYTTENTSLFVSGPVKKEEVLEFCKKAFSSVQKSQVSLHTESSKAGNKDRKFVIVGDDFSEELTQIVLQYTSLSLTKADVAAVSFNDNSSYAKKLLLKQRNLAIREAEYINFEAAHKNGCSRLIIQSLLEKPVNSKVNLAEQAELFISKTREGIAETEEREFEAGKEFLIRDFSKILKNSEIFMDYLSQFRTSDVFSTETSKEKSAANRLLERETLVKEADVSSIKEELASENPFIFVLLNTKTYKIHKAAFEKMGYKTITEKNAGWFKDKSYFELGKPEGESVSSATEENPENELLEGSEENGEDFISESRSSLKRINLQNGIPVTVKTTKTTGNILILVSLSLGKFSFENDIGFEEVITRAFANNIQKEIYKYSKEGILEREVEVLSETFNSWTAITVECAKEDAGVCLKSIADALIFQEILPSEADSVVYSVQTQKRLYNASPQNQMTYRGIRWLYDQNVIRKVFSTDDDVLTATTYQEIIAAYPSLLDSRLYNIVIVGNIDYDYLLEPLKRTFGLFAPHSTEKKETVLQEIEIPNDKAVSVKIRHLFYTDVKAEDAGPMPAVLIPTVNFSDPVQFWIPAPSQSFSKPEGFVSKEEIIYDSLIYRFKELLEEEGKRIFEERGEEIFTAIKLFKRTREFPVSSLTFMGVNHTKKVEDLFSEVRIKLLDALDETKTDSGSLKTEANLIKNAWILNALSGTKTNRGSAILIREGGRNFGKYLDETEIIQNAEIKDFYECAKKWLPSKPPLRLYSSESKR